VRTLKNYECKKFLFEWEGGTKMSGLFENFKKMKISMERVIFSESFLWQKKLIVY
jgi:hypothetical protein